MDYSYTMIYYPVCNYYTLMLLRIVYIVGQSLVTDLAIDPLVTQLPEGSLLCASDRPLIRSFLKLLLLGPLKRQTWLHG